MCMYCITLSINWEALGLARCERVGEMFLHGQRLDESSFENFMMSFIALICASKKMRISCKISPLNVIRNSCWLYEDRPPEIIKRSPDSANISNSPSCKDATILQAESTQPGTLAHHMTL
mmetsp:Transcript_25016/g.34903  ORF Transcript_25016/g.34903 Transcript_25016/m.34903 type:complete len:120 (-) Transcript_25016:80-439(-)